MATLVLSAVGTAIGGPIGGTIGSIIGSQIDAAIFAPPGREGPRLQELKVTTSSYGTPVPRHFGKMRAAGTIIWATDLKEASEKSGGKGQPSVTTYTYSASFAVALASRPIASVGRIWADGNLLRGSAGDLKVAGELRIYKGVGNQRPDPLIASAEGNACPAFRGLAYCVFEDLQLADFGNRIPSLTFEVIADDGTVSLSELLRPVAGEVSTNRQLGALQGYSDEGGTLAENLASLDRVYPLSSSAGDNHLVIQEGDPGSDEVVTLPEAVVDQPGDSFGGAQGRTEKRGADVGRIPAGIRYYDVARDYQAGMQRTGGRASPGRSRLIEFPGALNANDARRLADEAAERARWGQDKLSYRIGEIDAELSPGRVVAVPGRRGKWRIDAWEWRENGIELELIRLPQRKGAQAPADSGRSLPQIDLIPGPTLLEAFELPWDGSGSADQRQIFAATSSPTAGWTGASLYSSDGASLELVGPSGKKRSAIGTTLGDLAPSSSVLLDRQSEVVIASASSDFVLESCTIADLAMGANRAFLGGEIIQFARAENLGDGQWRISILMRGRGGTEHLAHQGHLSGSSFVLLDEGPLRLEESKVADRTMIAAIGLADQAPVVDAIEGIGSSLRPLAPVHAKYELRADGTLHLQWKRRARGAWTWPGTVDVPLVEQTEAYEVGVGSPDAPDLVWPVTKPGLVLDQVTTSQLNQSYSGKPLWVRQIGTHAASLPTLLETID